MATDKKLKYRVKQGATYGPEHQYKAGSIVELTEKEAEPFQDKLELTGGRGNAPAGLKNDLNVSIPDDLLLHDSEDEIVEESPAPEAKPKGKTQRKNKGTE